MIRGLTKELEKEIDKTIADEYPEKPEWVSACYEIRNRNIAYEFNRLTEKRGLTATRAKQVLSVLVRLSDKAIEKILFK